MHPQIGVANRGKEVAGVLAVRVRPLALICGANEGRLTAAPDGVQGRATRPHRNNIREWCNFSTPAADGSICLVTAGGAGESPVLRSIHRSAGDR